MTSLPKLHECPSSTHESLEDLRNKKKIISDPYVKTWISMSFRICERMCEKVTTPFFINIPQIISNLAFLISICESENTVGLRREFKTNCGNQLSSAQTIALIDETVDFLKNWTDELRSASKPGHLFLVRRAFCHPKYAKAYSFNTFKALRRFEVELKLYEGNQEVLLWLSKNLKADVPTKKLLNLWVDEQNENQQMTKRNNSIKKMTDNSKGAFDKCYEPHELREEQKPPILVWASHMIIAIHPDIFDASSIFTIKNRKCIKIQETLNKKIKSIRGEYAFNTVLIPTTSKNLELMIIYGHERFQINLENLKNIRQKYNENIPCLIRKIDDNSSFSLLKSIFIPSWNLNDFEGANVAEHFLASLDMNSIFYTGGFGDLAVPDAEPSAASNPIKIPHIQHFNAVSLVNLPCDTENSFEKTSPIKGKSSKSESKTENSSKLSKVEVIPTKDSFIVPIPFLVVLWDSNRDIPVLMGKICEKHCQQKKEEKKCKNCTIF